MNQKTRDGFRNIMERKGARLVRRAQIPPEESM